LASQLDDAETATENLSEMKTALEGLLVEWAPERCATCGVIVTIDHQGRIDVRRGLMRPEDRKAHVQSLKEAGQPVPPSLQGADAAKGERAVHSAPLMLDLRAYRTAALQAALARDTHVAFALVVQRLVCSRCGGAAARTVDRRSTGST
jgi:ParB family chromosome partitioning protein